MILRRVPRRSRSVVLAPGPLGRVLAACFGLIVPLLLLGLWQVASSQGWIDERLYPAPSTIASEARHLWDEGTLAQAVWETLDLLFRGFVVGCLSGFLAGAFMGVSLRARRAFEPLLTSLYTVPKLALLPLFLGMFGLGDGPKIALVSVTIFFFVWIQTMEAFATVPEGYLEAARSLGVSRAEMFLHVLLPAALPQLFVALRVAMSVGILVIIAAEFVIGSEGVGYLINSARQVFVYSQAYVGIVLAALLGVVLSAVISFIGRLCTPWERKSAPSGARA
jgi:sulfonate transport system permease protein